MTALLRLYPRRWRLRYGAEMEEMLAGRPFSLAVAIDLIAGAIDVRLHPGVTMAAAMSQPEGVTNMEARPIGLNCSAGGRISTADQWRASGLTVGGTLVLTLAWMGLHVWIGDNAYVDSFSIFPFMVALLLSTRVTYLKHRPFSVYALFVLGWSAVFAAFLLGIGWLTARM